MTDDYYSFDETDALLETLSASSMPTLSPFDRNSVKSSSYSDSSNENNFIQDNWGLNRFSEAELSKVEQNEAFNNNNINTNFLNFGNNNNNAVNTGFHNDDLFVSPSTSSEYISPPFLGNMVKSEGFKSIKEEENEDFADGEASSFNSDKDENDSENTRPKSSGSTSSSSSSSKNKITKPKKDRSSHTVIEKKYRTNINTKITELRNAVPALRVASGDKEINIDDLDGLSLPSKVNKATIFTKATEYIRHLEGKNDKLFEENQQLKQLLSSNVAQNLDQNCTFAQQQQSQPQQQMQQMPLSQFQPATDLNGNPINVVNQHQPNYQIGLPGKLLMGGLTMMAGQTLLNGNGGTNYDQYGLSAFPILSTPQFGLFIKLVQALICFSSLIYVFAPNVFSGNQEEIDNNKKTMTKNIEKTEWYELIKELIFVYTGDLEKTEISEFDASKLINDVLLNPKNETRSVLNLVHLLLRLQTFKPNFEVLFGKIIISKSLLSYSNLFQSTFFISSILNSIIDVNLNEISKNQKINDTYLRCFFKEFLKPSSSFKNSECFKRLLNLALGLEIDLNCTKGSNDKGYELILNDEQVIQDYKSLLVSFRANELFREALLEYINLTFGDESIKDLSNDDLKELKTGLWNKLIFCEKLSPENSVLDVRIKVLKSICNVKYLDPVLKLIDDELQEVPVVAKNQMAEEYSDFEEEDKERKTNGLVSHRRFSRKFNKVLSQDLFDSLVCSTVLKSISLKKKEETVQLLRHLDLNKNGISLLSFVSVYKLIEKFPKDWLLESDDPEMNLKPVLGQIIGNLRLWIGDVKNSSFKDLENEGVQFKREISDHLVELSKKLNEY